MKNKIGFVFTVIVMGLVITSCEKNMTGDKIKQNVETETSTLGVVEERHDMPKDDRVYREGLREGLKMAKKLDSVKRSQKNTEETVKYIEHQPRISLLPHTPETLKKYQDGIKELKESMTEAQQQMDSLNRAQQTNPENVNTGTE